MPRQHVRGTIPNAAIAIAALALGSVVLHGAWRLVAPAISQMSLETVLQPA